MRSRLPWIGLASRVWSRMMGFFHSFKRLSSFHGENSGYFINCLLQRIFLNYFYGQSGDWAIFPYSRSCFNIWTGIFSVHRNILSKPLFSLLPLKRSTQNKVSKHPHLALPWPTETEFSLHKHMIILTTTPSTAAQMLLWTEHVHKRCKSTMSFASLLLPLFSFTIKQLRVKRIINAIKRASFKNSLILVNALMEQ